MKMDGSTPTFGLFARILESNAADISQAAYIIVCTITIDLVRAKGYQ